MRKAFDANVPKLRPRLRGNGAPAAEVEAALPAPDATPAVPPPAADPAPPHSHPAMRIAEAMAAKVAAEPAEILSDLSARRARLEKIKRKVADAARARPRVEAAPESTSQAAESVLGLARDLETQLTRSREAEEALRADLEAARAELARAAGEARGHAERVGTAEREAEEKRAVLAELLGELSALEEERDRALERAQALSALDEERQQLADGLAARADQAELARVQARDEADRLSEELDQKNADAARLRATLAEVTRERDELHRELTRTRHERDELAEARRALEQVHQALASARSRIG